MAARCRSSANNARPLATERKASPIWTRCGAEAPVEQRRARAGTCEVPPVMNTASTCAAADSGLGQSPVERGLDRPDILGDPALELARA